MKRLHRLRFNSHIRDLCSQTDFTLAHLIQPLFVVEGLNDPESLSSLREVKRDSEAHILEQINQDLDRGVRHFILFLVPQNKKEKNFDHSFSSRIISKIKNQFTSQIQLWVDVCLCSLTIHGHCAIFDKEQKINSTETLNELSKTALNYAQAGADGVSPSDMMDGRTQMIRKTLDENGFEMTPLMSYSTKFASHFYGPFRTAAHSTPQFGDRKSYQIDVRNRSDAIHSSLRCAEEGADLLMVKPGLTSLDLINPIKEKTQLNVGAYQVSGEYAALTLLAKEGFLSFEDALLETWHVYRRAGAQFIITYGARFAHQLGVKS